MDHSHGNHLTTGNAWSGLSNVLRRNDRFMAAFGATKQDSHRECSFWLVLGQKRRTRGDALSFHRFSERRPCGSRSKAGGRGATSASFLSN